MPPVTDPFSVSVGGQTFTIDQQPGGSVVVDGIVDNTAIVISTANGFNSLAITYESGDAFALTGVGNAVFDPGAQVKFGVPVELVDADGDATTAALSLTLLPGGPSAPPDSISTPITPTAADRTTRQRSRLAARPFRSPTSMLTITDPDSTTMASATISMIANGQVPPNDTLSISGILPGGITASAYNPVTGVLTLTGVASIADYEAALHQVVFSTADSFFNADRIISVTVNDGANTSNTAQDFMHVVGVAQFTATDVNDPSQLLDANFGTQSIDGTVTDVTVMATNDLVRTAVNGPGSTTVVPEWALLHDDTSSVGKILDITATGSVSDLRLGQPRDQPGIGDRRQQ